MLDFIKRRIRALIILTINIFLCGTHLFELKRRLLNLCHGIRIEQGSKVVGPIYMGQCSEVLIGKNVWVGRNLKIYGDGKVAIESNCDLAPDVMFITGSHEIGTSDRRAGKGLLFKIKVGEGCWLGARTMIVGNINIGAASIVAAGSVVTKEVGRNHLVAGVPAKLLKNLE